MAILVPSADAKQLINQHSFAKTKAQELYYFIKAYYTIKYENIGSVEREAGHIFSLVEEIIILFDGNISTSRVMTFIDEYLDAAILAFKSLSYDSNRLVFIERLGSHFETEYRYSRSVDERFVEFFLSQLPELKKELSSRKSMIFKDNGGAPIISFDINGELCKSIGREIVIYRSLRHDGLINEFIEASINSAESKSKKFISELQANAKVEISEFLSILMKNKQNELSDIRVEFKNFNDGYIKEFDGLKKQINDNDIFSKEVMNKANSLLESAKDIHGKTNREAMAGTFEKISKELIKPLWVWAIGLFISLGVIFAVGIAFYVEGAESLTIPQLLSRVFLITPMLWLAWFCGRQYNHTSKLRQDYRYKSAVAKAYHGYKSETGEENDQMHAHLLHNIVNHFSDNPVRLYDKTESSMPIEEFLKKISPDHLVEVLKAAMQAKSDKDLKSK